MVVKEDAFMNPEHEESDPETESESEEDEDDNQEVVKLAEPSKTAVYNREGLLEKLGDISWPDNLDWVHRLDINREEQEKVDVNDDLARELSFYTQALEGAREGLLKFQSMGKPFLRPSDYYAEMVKSDTHMEKVKGRLLAEKRKIEEAEERRKARDNKKLSKEVQVQKMKERTKQKKHEIESVKKWRKQRQQSGFDKDGGGELDLPFAGEEHKPFQRSGKKRPGVSPGDRSGGRAKFGAKGKKGADNNRKGRERRDSKYGFGGSKGLKKQNTAETTNEFKGFNKGEVSAKKRRMK